MADCQQGFDETAARAAVGLRALHTSSSGAVHHHIPGMQQQRGC